MKRKYKQSFTQIRWLLAKSLKLEFMHNGPVWGLTGHNWQSKWNASINKVVACCMQLQKHQFEGGKKSALVKNNIPKQHGERKVENLRYTLHTVGALSFKTCHRSFSLENAVSLTSSHAAEPCCITMTQECPSPSRKSSQCNSSLGEGKIEERAEGAWWGVVVVVGANKREPDYPWSRLIHKPTEGNPSPAGSNRNLCTR